MKKRVKKTAAELPVRPPTAPAAPVTKLRLVTPTGVWDVGLTVPPAVLPLQPLVALTVGAPAVLSADVAKADPAGFLPGLHTPSFREYFLAPDALPGAAGILALEQKEDGTWGAKLSKTLLPFVLSKTAVTEGLMPPAGKSALPASLEAVVPGRFRYWDEQDAGRALAKRNALADSGFFPEEMLKLVDGDIRLCVQQLFLFEPDDTEPATKTKTVTETLMDVLSGIESAVIANPLAKDAWQAALAVDAADPGNLLALSPTPEQVGEVVDAMLAAPPAAAWLVESVDTPTARAALEKLAPLFKLSVDPGHVYAASFLPRDPAVAWLEQTVTKTEKRSLRILTQKADDEAKPERYVLGIVLEPETVDAQQDIYSDAEIRQTAHKFMEDFRVIGLMHKGAVNDKVKILESYLAPADFEVDGVPVKKGTWLMGVRVLDDELWESVKSGELSGFSIGGSAIRKPDAPAEASLVRLTLWASSLHIRGDPCGRCSRNPCSAPPPSDADGGGVSGRPRSKPAEVSAREEGQHQHAHRTTCQRRGERNLHRGRCCPGGHARRAARGCGPGNPSTCSKGGPRPDCRRAKLHVGDARLGHRRRHRYQEARRRGNGCRDRGRDERVRPGRRRHGDGRDDGGRSVLPRRCRCRRAPG